MGVTSDSVGVASDSVGVASGSVGGCQLNIGSPFRLSAKRSQLICVYTVGLSTIYGQMVVLCILSR